MWVYEKKLEYPVNLKKKDVKMAHYLISQFGGPDGELGAALRYLSQRYTMPDGRTKGLLTDIGTEELAHVEIISTMVYQLLQGATPEEIKKEGLSSYYTQHGLGIYPTDASGVPFSAAAFQSIGNPVADLNEDLAAEQKAKVTYEHLIALSDDHDIKDVLKFLWARELVHYQRFGEALVHVEDNQKSKKYF